MKLTLHLIFAALSFNAFSQSPLKLSNPGSVATPKGYSHVAQIDVGNATMLLIAGQVPLDKQGNLVGKDDMAGQTAQVFTNIRNIIEAAGGNMNHLAKISIFIKDISKIQEVREVRDKFVNTKEPPASTLVEVSNFYRNDVLIEIEATAVIPKK